MTGRRQGGEHVPVAQADPGALRQRGRAGRDLQGADHPVRGRPFHPGRDDRGCGARQSSALRAKGLQVTLDHLGEDTTDRATADATVAAYLELIDALAAAGQVAGAEVSVKLSAVGQALLASPDLPGGGNAYALAGARQIADAAYAAGARVNLDMEDHTTVDQTLEVLFELRRTHPDVGVAIQAMLLRTPEGPGRAHRPRVPGATGQGRLQRAGRRRVHRSRTRSTWPTSGR